MCFSLFLLGFILYGTLCFLNLIISFPMLGKFFTIISSNIFSDPFSYSSFGTHIIQMLVCLMLFQRSLRLCSILFILFSLFYFAAVISTILFLAHLSILLSVILLLIPPRVFLISGIIVFIIACLFFNVSRSSLNISCISPILFPRFGIIFTIITLNYFSGRLPISFSLVVFCPAPSSVTNFSVFSLFNLLCLRFPFYRLQCQFFLLRVASLVGEAGCSKDLCWLPGGRDWCLCSGGEC